MDSLVRCKGKDLELLTRDELVEALQWSRLELRHQREELLALRAHVDWGSYLMAKACTWATTKGASDDV